MQFRLALKLLCSPGWPWSCNSSILPPNCWDYRYVLLCVIALGCFTQALTPFNKLLPLWPSHLPRIQPSNTITWRSGFQHMNYWRGKHLGHTVTVSQLDFGIFLGCIFLWFWIKLCANSLKFVFPQIKEFESIFSCNED
jgi:hypothetical protein